MAQLAVKVFSMTVKTASKPLAYIFQDYALSHPVVRQRAIDGAQYLHRWNVRLTRASRGQEKKSEIALLKDEQALALAGKFLSESFIYAVGGGLLLYEYDRGNRKELQKKAEKEERRLAKEKKLNAVHDHHLGLISELESKVEDLERKLMAVEGRGQERHKPQGGWGIF